MGDASRDIPRIAEDATKKFSASKLDGIHRQLQEQGDGLTVRMRGAEHRLDEHDTAIAQMRDEIKQMREALALANTQPKPAITSASFEREIDHTVIKVFASKVANFNDVKQCLTDWITSIDVQVADFDIVSTEQVPRFFTVKLLGAVGPATRRVQQIGCPTSRTWRMETFLDC